MMRVLAGIVLVSVLAAGAAKQAALGGMDGFVERMGAGARELGRGNTGSADTLALPGAFWNPGLLAFRRGLALSLHGENRDLDRAGGSFGLESRAGARMGLGLGLLFRGDTDFQVVNEDDQNLGSASPTFMMGYLGLGYRLSRRDGIGLTLSLSYDNMDVAGLYDDADRLDMVDTYQSPISFNFGWYRAWNERWSSSVVIRNLGLNSRLSASWTKNPNRVSSAQSLRPKVLQVGVGYSASLAGRPAKLWLEAMDYQVADTLLVFDPDWHIWKARLGFEMEVIPKGHARAGLDDGNPTLGLGYLFDLRIGSIRLPLQVDYALVYEWEAELWNPLSFGLRAVF